MIIKFVIKILPICLPSGLTVAAPDAFGRIPGVGMHIVVLILIFVMHYIIFYRSIYLFVYLFIYLSIMVIT